MAYLKYFNDERVNLARGLMRNASSIHKFGAVPSMSINTTGTIWDIGDTLYPWSAFSSASVINIDCASSSDAGVGKYVTVVGLDDSYNEVSETINLAVQNNNTGTQLFKRVFRAYIGNGATNVGDINIQVSTTNVARITASQGQTLMAIYTVPAGYTGLLMKGTMSAQAGADATGNMYIRYFGQDAFRIGHSFEVSGDGGAYYYDFATPVAIPEKSDIDVRASVRSNNGRYTAAFDMILINDDGTGLR